MKHRQEYFDQAVTWASDAQNLNARSRRTAWIVAGVAVGMAAFEAVALAMLAPLSRSPCWSTVRPGLFRHLIPPAPGVWRLTKRSPIPTLPNM